MVTLPGSTSFAIFVQGADRILNEAGAVLSLSGDDACPGGAHRLVGRQTQRAQWRKGYHVGAQHSGGAGAAS